jgi:GH15 family glucan-1,4-alpha-glucosidase
MQRLNLKRRKRHPMKINSYPSIGDYGFIADCHSAALISKAGSIDWCCMPRMDSSSCFGRILDWERGGFCKIAPAVPCEIRRRYLDRTLVLETTFRTETGRARLIDCFTMRRGGQHHPHGQILRIIEGLSGTVDFTIEVIPRLDYGAIKPWIRSYREHHFSAVGGSDGLLISSDAAVKMKHRHDLAGSCTVAAGQRKHISILHRSPESLSENMVDIPVPEELDRRLQETVEWWQTWSDQGRCSGPYAGLLQRSAIVLKGLSNAPTGAIAAAPTTSLPESSGGSRNWDYRFSWIRDSSFTVRSLAQLNYVNEADGFRRFIERSTAGSADQLQILYGIGGERRLHEYEISDLEGYRGAKPVRIGNAAESQVQLDAYGELLDLAWHWHCRQHSPDHDYWEFLLELVNKVCDCWQDADRGIWEFRGTPRHFVHSKVMCWAALDYGIKLARDLNRNAPLGKWEKAREAVRRAVESRGYDAERGVFIQAFDYPVMDAALLLLPMVGFVAYDDKRMIRTTDMVRKELGENGLLRRYSDGGDGLTGREGVFLACSFWLAECLARQGRTPEARQTFQRVIATANDLGLFAEQFDPAADEMLGNFPQGLTHLSLITAAVALNEAAGDKTGRSGSCESA